MDRWVVGRWGEGEGKGGKEEGKKERKISKSLRDLWNTIKYTNITNGSPRRRGEKEAQRIVEEMMANNVSDLMKNRYLYIQEAQQTPSRVNSKKATFKSNLIKWSETKEQVLKVPRKKTSIHHIQDPQWD